MMIKEMRGRAARGPRFGDLEVIVRMNHGDVVLVKVRRIYHSGLVYPKMSNGLG